MSNLNLSELSKEIAKYNVQAVDALTAKYLEEVIKHITGRGEKIEDYALVLVSNPMQIIENGLRVSSQYRVMKVSELELLPTFEED